MKKLLIAAMLMASCIGTHPVSGITMQKITSVQKLKDGSAITLEGVRGRFIVPCDTLKVNDMIQVSWINNFRNK